MGRHGERERFVRWENSREVPDMILASITVADISGNIYGQWTCCIPESTLILSDGTIINENAFTLNQTMRIYVRRITRMRIM